MKADRYTWSLYSMQREVTPGGKWGIKTGRDSEFTEIVRREFDGELVFTGDDYVYLKGLLDAKEYRQLVIQITKKTGEFWKGFFSIYDFKVNENKCTITFTPKVWDSYSKVMDLMEYERNALEVSPVYTVTASTYLYLTEDLWIFNCGGVPGMPVWHQHPDGGYYYLYEAEYTQDDYCVYLETLRYTREYVFSDDSVNPPGGDPTWNYIEETSPGVFKWARPIGNSVYQNYLPGGGLIWKLDMPVAPPLFFDMDYVRARRLNDILTYYFAQAGLTYASSFFQDAANPISGVALELFLQQASDFISQTSPATKGILKLADLLRNINNIFNCQMYIDAAGDARIENKRYFVRGESYAGPITVGLDLTAAPYATYAEKHKVYSFKPNFVRYEKWEFPYANNTDFEGMPIRYPQNCITNSDTKKFISDWATDLAWIYDHQEDVSKTGWNLIHADAASYNVVLELGVLTGSNQINGHLSTANLLENYWLDGRQLEQGYLNSDTTLTDFESTEHIKIQAEFNVPVCDDDLDFYKLVRTELGYGRLISAVYNSQTEMYLLTLDYE